MRLLWSFVPLIAQPEYSWATGTTSPRCAISAFWGRLSHILARNPICQKDVSNYGFRSSPHYPLPSTTRGSSWLLSPSDNPRLTARYSFILGLRSADQGS